MEFLTRSAVLELLGAAALAGTGTAAVPQTAPGPKPAADPTERFVNDPRPQALSPYGFALPPRVIRDAGVQFGRALRLPIPRQDGDGGPIGGIGRREASGVYRSTR